jgi:hypothetical protein
LAHFNVIRTRVVLSVIPVSAFSTLRGASARYAEVIPGNVIQLSTVARIPSTWLAYASARLFIKALAQHALAADAASRQARSGLFSAPVSATMCLPFIAAAPLKLNPLGASQFAICLDLIVHFLSFWHKEAVLLEGTNRAWDEGSLCRVIPVSVFSTLRGASARCADCNSVQRLTKATWYEGSWC